MGRSYLCMMPGPLVGGTERLEEAGADTAESFGQPSALRAVS